MSSFIKRALNYRSTMLLSAALFMFGVGILDQYYRQIMRNNLAAALIANDEAIVGENYSRFLLNFDRFSAAIPAHLSHALYVRGQRRSGDSHWPLYLQDTTTSPTNSTQINLIGLFRYRLTYTFYNQDYLFFLDYQERNLFEKLLFLLMACIFLPVTITMIARKLDLDNTLRIRNDFAVSLAAKAIHFVKTHVYYANELFKWTSELVKTEDSHQLKQILEGFQSSQIEMEGIKSILRLPAFKKSLEYIDVSSMLDQLLKCYGTDKVVVKKYYEHINKLNIDRDIFVATAGNILKNACEYSSGLVWIKTLEERGHFHILISNTGRYLDRKSVKQILLQGQSLEGSSGLGLSICQVWMDKIGGKLTVQSHKGANTFELVFPNNNRKEDFQDEKIRTEDIKDSFSAEGNIIIIEDIPSFRDQLCYEIKKLGFSVDAFSDMDSFFDYFEQEYSKVSVVVVDRHLRGFDAVRDRFADACRHYGYQGRIVLYTGDMSPSINKEADYQFDLVLHKDEQIDWKSILS